MQLSGGCFLVLGDIAIYNSTPNAAEWWLFCARIAIYNSTPNAADSGAGAPDTTQQLM